MTDTEFELEITDLTHEGQGVGRIDGKAVFVPGALAGERVRVRVGKRKRSFDSAQLIDVLRPSPDRVTPRCQHFGVCGGCVLQHLEPAAQIEAKRHVLQENLQRIGRVEPERWLPALTAGHWGYRRKARLGVKWVAKKGRVLVGFREAADPRFIAELQRCEVLIPAVGERLADLAALIESLDARERIPQIEVAAGDDATVLVFRHLEPLTAADRERLRDFGQRHRLAIYLQPGGNESVVALDGNGPRLHFGLVEAAVEFDFQPLDFVQINAGINAPMVAQALELLDLQPQQRVLDLFCGLGNFTLPLARRVREVVGVEGEAGLVRRAQANAERNGIANARFFAADLAKSLTAQPWMTEAFDRLLLDPPRTGARELLEQFPLAGIERLVYVSCHPGSLARDAGQLVHQAGFRLLAAGVMDMFPHTAHVESIAVFGR